MRRVKIDWVAAQGVEVELDGGRVVTITPLRVVDLPGVVAVVSRLSGLFAGIPGGLAALSSQADPALRDEAVMHFASGLVTPEACADLRELLSKLLREPEDFCDTLRLDMAAVLLVMALGENMDFFTRAMPVVKSALAGSPLLDKMRRAADAEAAPESATATAQASTGLTPSRS